MNGSDALAILEGGKIDLLLLDVLMPGIDGIEVCKRLRSQAATMGLPIIILSALDQPEDRVRGLQAGAHDFLIKPINDIALLVRIKSLLRRANRTTGFDSLSHREKERLLALSVQRSDSECSIGLATDRNY